MALDDAAWYKERVSVDALLELKGGTPRESENKDSVLFISKSPNHDALKALITQKPLKPSNLTRARINQDDPRHPFT
jgi:hypothetical protein